MSFISPSLYLNTCFITCFTVGAIYGYYRALNTISNTTDITFTKNVKDFYTLIRLHNTSTILKIKHTHISGSFNIWSDDIQVICNIIDNVTYVTGLPLSPRDIGHEFIMLHSKNSPDDGSAKKSRIFYGDDKINLDFCNDIQESTFFD